MAERVERRADLLAGDPGVPPDSASEPAASCGDGRTRRATSARSAAGAAARAHRAGRRAPRQGHEHRVDVRRGKNTVRGIARTTSTSHSSWAITDGVP